MKPCILSLELPVLDELKKNYTPSTQPDREWVTLTADQTQAILSRAIKSGKTDCGTINSMQEGIDYWGNRMHIMFRLRADAMLDLKISSAGPDGKEYTGDDIELETRSGR